MKKIFQKIKLIILMMFCLNLASCAQDELKGRAFVMINTQGQLCFASDFSQVINVYSKEKVDSLKYINNIKIYLEQRNDKSSHKVWTAIAKDYKYRLLDRQFVCMNEDHIHFTQENHRPLVENKQYSVSISADTDEYAQIIHFTAKFDYPFVNHNTNVIQSSPKDEKNLPKN